MKTYSIITLLVGIIGTASFGSGFVCKDVAEALTVQMYNYVHKEDGTRNPAVLVVSDSHLGTLVRRFGDAIRKSNRVHTVRYTVSGGEREDGLAFETAILQIHYKEGRETISMGETVQGELVLILNGEKDVTNLTCERYLSE